MRDLILLIFGALLAVAGSTEETVDQLRELLASLF